jgi:hypothetical protein
MKKLILLISLVLALGINALAQNINTDFVVLDYSCPNGEVLKAQYKGQANSFVVTASQLLAPGQITKALTGKKVNDLHIFVWSKPGSMVFTSIALTPENIQEYTSLLATWKSHVSGKVVVHSTDVFTAERGLDFKAKLEQITGLTFIMK